MKAVLARVHNALAWVVTAGSVLQFFLIALSVFGGGSVTLHGNAGRALVFVAMAMTIVAVIIRTSRRTTWYSVAVLLLLVPVQGIFVYLEMPPVLKSVHALTGTAILVLSYSLAAGRAKAVAEVQPALQPASTD